MFPSWTITVRATKRRCLAMATPVRSLQPTGWEHELLLVPPATIHSIYFAYFLRLRDLENRFLPNQLRIFYMVTLIVLCSWFENRLKKLHFPCSSTTSCNFQCWPFIKAILSSFSYLSCCRQVTITVWGQPAVNAGLNVGSNLHPKKSLYRLALTKPNAIVTPCGTVAALWHGKTDWGKLHR